MRSLRLIIILFFLAVSFPLAFVIWQTYSGLEQEERGQLRYFSETIFEQMEQELAALIEIEENRAVDEYGQYIASDTDRSSDPSPLATVEYQDYILGYLQNNPDGSFQTPLQSSLTSSSNSNLSLIKELEAVNTIFNTKKLSVTPPAPPADLSAAVKEELAQESKTDSFSERYLTKSKSRSSDAYLGKKQQRVEKITPEQAQNIAPVQKTLSKFDNEQKRQQDAKSPSSIAMEESAPDSMYDDSSYSRERSIQNIPDTQSIAPGNVAQKLDKGPSEELGFQVEVAPFQSVSINDEQVYIFRRIAINNQIYRQGFVILVEPLLRHLAASHFARQPLSHFTTLKMLRRDLDINKTLVQLGTGDLNSGFFTEHVFPPPFHFLKVSISTQDIPKSPARNSLNVALIVLGVIMFLGLITIYQSARTIVIMSERRSQFVSSVTHELKTPLTNIRMYIEMLEQGIAATPEHEQEYLAILNTESARLSGLINNVLELAKLEKKQRQFTIQEGRLDELLTEVSMIMAEKLKQSGFTLHIGPLEVEKFAFDREVLIQILTNLIENSIKFGQNAPVREIAITAKKLNNSLQIHVTDTGPGIPSRSLIKVFDDFYRVDNDLTRKTGGTGIGLALVKKFMNAMGGSVKAVNNPERGCTISLILPTSS